MLRLCRIDAFDNALFSASLHYPGLARPASRLPPCAYPALPLLVAAAQLSVLGSVNRVWLYGALSPKSQTKLQTNLPLPAQTETRLKANNNNKLAKCLKLWQRIQGNASADIDIYRDSLKLLPLLLRLICLRQISPSHTHTHRDSSTLNTD